MLHPGAVFGITDEFNQRLYSNVRWHQGSLLAHGSYVSALYLAEQNVFLVIGIGFSTDEGTLDPTEHLMYVLTKEGPGWIHLLEREIEP
jgi:hypothetical protein